jgi:hypothetical protein
MTRTKSQTLQEALGKALGEDFFLSQQEGAKTYAHEESWASCSTTNV